MTWQVTPECADSSKLTGLNDPIQHHLADLPVCCRHWAFGSLGDLSLIQVLSLYSHFDLQVSWLVSPPYLMSITYSVSFECIYLSKMSKIYGCIIFGHMCIHRLACKFALCVRKRRAEMRWYEITTSQMWLEQCSQYEVPTLLWHKPRPAQLLTQAKLQ